MPNGDEVSPFQELLKQWDAKAAKYQKQLEVSSTKLEELQTQLRQAYEKPLLPEGMTPEQLEKYQQQPLLQRLFPFEAPPTITVPLERRRLKADVEVEAANVAKAEFYTRLYSVIPPTVMGNQVFTVDEALSVVQPPANLTTTELDEVREAIQTMINSYADLPEPELATGGEAELPELVPPIRGYEGPVTLQVATVESILKALTAPRIPEPVMPEEEWQELITMSYPEYANMSQVEVMEAEAKRIMADSKLANEQMAEFQNAVAEMPDYELGDFLKELALQPGLAILEVAGKYFEKVTMPMAAKVYKTFIPDIEILYQQHRMTSDSDWEALQKAWEEWDAPGGGVPEFLLKYMFMETLVDPLTWLSIFTAGTSMVAGMTGRFGRFAAMVAKANRTVWAPFEAPFNFAKWVVGGKWSAEVVRALHLPERYIGQYVIPKTISQRAFIAESWTGKIIKSYMEKFSKGKLLNKGMTMKDWDKLAKRAIRYVFNNPNATDEIAETGRLLLKHKPIDQATISRWAKRMGLTLPKEEITQKMVADINLIFEQMFSKYRARTGKLLLPGEAAKRLISVLGLGGADDKVFKVARKVLEQRAANIIADAASFSKLANPAKALRQLMRRNFRTHIAIEESAAFLARKQLGRFAALLADIEPRFVAIWRNYIEKYAIRPLAESYLAFGMYGPMNVMEDYWRSVLGGIFPRRMTPERMQQISVGLVIDPSMIDPNIGISEAIGRMRRRGAESEWNNWVLQMAMVGQKDWAEKLYTGLVRLPSGFGMDIRRNFLGQKYLHLLKEHGGDTFKALLKSEGRLPILPDKRMLKALRQDVHDLMLAIGKPENAQMVKDMWTRQKIYRKEVQGIMKEHPDLPNAIRDSAVEAFDDGSLFAEGGKSIQSWSKEANIKLLDEYLKGAEYATKQFQQLTDVLTALEVRNPEEMAHLLLNLNIASQVYGATPKQLMAQTTIRSRGLSLAERRARFDKTFDDIMEFMDKAGGNIEEVVNKLRLTVTKPESMIDWSKVDLKVGDYANQIKQMVDKLPLSIRPNIKAIKFDARLKRFGARWNPRTKTITIRDPDNIGNLYHELAHSISNEWIGRGDYEMISAYSRAVRPGLPTPAESVSTIREAASKEGVTHYEAYYKIESFRQLEEDFARNLAEWITKGQATADRTAFFGTYFPLAQRKLPFTQEYIDKAGRLFDLLTAKRQLADQFRSENIAFRREYFAGVERKDMTSEWWDDFFRRIDSQYHDFNVKMAGLDGDFTRAITDLDVAAGVEPFRRNPVRVVDRALAPQDIANLIGCQGDDLSRAILDNLITVNDRDMFIEYVLAKVRPGDEGFTREAIGEVYDQIAYSLKVSPDAMGWITSKQMELKAVHDDLHYLYNSKLLPDDQIAEIGRYVDETARTIEDLMYTKVVPPGKKRPVKMVKEEFKDYDQLRQKAMDEAHKWYYKEYTDYTNANAVDSIMKAIYPFWTYETQRWFWIPRSFVRHPGTFTTFERWQDNTDYGYVHIPGTSIDVNPFRGTVYGPLTTRLTRRDFPEYYDAWEGSERIISFMDWLSRYGFYPGGHVAAPLALFGGIESQAGETIPPIWRTPLMALQVITGGKNDFVNTIVDRIFPDRFRNYLIIAEVTARGYDGTLIHTKIREGIQLTEEEQAAWDSSRQTVAAYSILFEQGGLFRLRKEEQRAIYDAATKYIEEKYGYTEDQQKWLRMHGHRIWDQIGGMSFEDSMILEELDYFRYLGLSRPLLPGRQQAVLDRLELDWDEVERYVDAQRKKELQWEREFQAGYLSAQDFNARLVSMYDKRREFIDHKMEENPNMTLEGRKKYYEEFNVPMPVLHPLRELANLYFSVELKEVRNPETGALEKDWATFWAQRHVIEEAIPDRYKGEWETYLSRKLNPIERIRGQVYKDYFSKYNYVWQKVLDQYSEEERKLVEEFLYLERMDKNFARQDEIKQYRDAQGRQLISGFRSDVTEARRALRYANPTLDAWLNYWGRVGSFLTPQAEEVFQQICRNTGRKV
jgi:hypothetical protein